MIEDAYDGNHHHHEDSSIDHHHFDYGYDSDEPPPMVKNIKDKLLWRQDPTESVSDWTIEITYNVSSDSSASSSNQSSKATTSTSAASSNSSSGAPQGTSPSAPTVAKTRKKTDVYHVHKCILSASPRKSEYFNRLFQHDHNRSPTKKKTDTLATSTDADDGDVDAAGSFIELQTNTSCIELDELAAIAFPYMLDYIYSMDHVLDVTTQTATALYYLGGYFELRSLRWDSKQFWLRDMDSTTCGTYYEHSKILQQEKIQQASILKCAQYVMNINPETSRLLYVPNNDEFWLSVLEANHPSNVDLQHSNNNRHRSGSSSRSNRRYHHSRSNSNGIGGNGSISNIESLNNNDSTVSAAVAAALLNESNHSASDYSNDGGDDNDENESIDSQKLSQHYAFSLHVSKLLSRYFINCGSVQENFEALTQKEYLPKIHHDAALPLLEAERVIANSNQSNTTTFELTCLQQRCIDSLAENWTYFADPFSSISSPVPVDRARGANNNNSNADADDAKRAWQAKLLQQQNPLLVTQLLFKVTQVAYQNLQVTRQKSQDEIDRERQRYVRAPIGSDLRNPDYYYNRGSCVRLAQPDSETMQDGLILSHQGNMYGVYYYDPNHSDNGNNDNPRDGGGDMNNNNLQQRHQNGNNNNGVVGQDSDNE